VSQSEHILESQRPRIVPKQSHYREDFSEFGSQSAQGREGERAQALDGGGGGGGGARPATTARRAPGGGAPPPPPPRGGGGGGPPPPGALTGNSGPARGRAQARGKREGASNLMIITRLIILLSERKAKTRERARQTASSCQRKLPKP
jgi:hypothetical protein